MEITDVGRNYKLESLVQGLYRVLENAVNTFRLKIGEETVRISSYRVTRTPGTILILTRNVPPKTGGRLRLSQEPRRSHPNIFLPP